MSTESLFLLIEAQAKNFEVFERAVDQIERLEKLSGGLKDTGSNITSLGESMSARVTAPIVAGMGAAAAAAISYESAMADVNKVMGFTADESAEMGTGILQLSRTLPLSAQGLAEIAAAGGQLGTAKDELLEFTELTAQMAIAFDMTAGQAGESIGELKNVYGLTLAETELLGDGINQLSNNAAANASDIVNAAGRIGGTAQQFGLAEAETAALATTLISFGAGPDRASTAINGMLPMLQTATGQSKRFQEGLADLGIEARDLEQAIAKDAMGGFQMFLEALGEMGGSERANVIQDMFGTGSDAQLLGTLSQNADQLQKNLDLVGDSSSYAGSMFSEFEARAATTENGLQLMQNAIGEILIHIGSGLVPAINDALGVLTPMAHAFANFASNNPGIVKIGLAIAGIVAAIGPVLIIVGKIVSVVGMLASAWATVQAAVMAFAGILAGIGAASLGPILLFIAAIAAAAWLIINNWDAVKLLFQQIGMAFMDAFAPVVPTLRQLWTNLQLMVQALFRLGMSIVQAIAQIFGFQLSAQQTSSVLDFLKTAFLMVVTTLFEFIAGLVNGIAQLAALGAAAITAAAEMVNGFVQGAAQTVAAVINMGSQIIDVITSIAGQAFNAGREIISRLAEGIRAGIGAVQDAASSVAQAISSFLPGSPVKSGPLRVLNNIGSNPGAEIANMVASGIQANIPSINAVMGNLSAPTAIAPSTRSTDSGVSIGSISMPVTINGTNLSSDELDALLEEHRQKFYQMIQDFDRNQARVAYS